MSEFLVSGRVQGARERDRGSFETTVQAQNESVAIEHCYANLGSRHGFTRREIEINSVNEQ